MHPESGAEVPKCGTRHANTQGMQCVAKHFPLAGIRVPASGFRRERAERETERWFVVAVIAVRDAAERACAPDIQPAPRPVRWQVE